MVKINYKFLPIKAHYLFFMSALGTVLPFLPVFGKQLGVSEVVIGAIYAVLPLLYLVLKPFFGFLIDYFHKSRKLIFVLVLILTNVFILLLIFIPGKEMIEIQLKCDSLQICNNSEITNVCRWTDGNSSFNLAVDVVSLCVQSKPLSCIDASNAMGTLSCSGPDSKFYFGVTFWAFTILISLTEMGNNISSCISDAICFDVLGEDGELKYGMQKLWGTLGYGISAMIGGFAMDNASHDVGQSLRGYYPAFIMATIFMAIDVACCTKLKLPPMPQSENIVKDICKLIRQPRVALFLVFALCVGICDATILFYLLWYLEDLAEATDSLANIKLLEGLTIAVGSVFGESLMLFLSGRIISKIGTGHTLSICFACYAIRLALIALIPSPWWILPVEIFLQGPSYALVYATIVTYANSIALPGTSGTVQGLIAGVDDGLGFSVGSLLGGIIYKLYGGRMLYGLTSGLALFCFVTYTILFNFYFKESTKTKQSNSPPLAIPTSEDINKSTKEEITMFILEKNNQLT